MCVFTKPIQCFSVDTLYSILRAAGVYSPMRHERPYKRPGMGATWEFVYPADTRRTYTRPKHVESVGSTNYGRDTEVKNRYAIT